jgi:hypothetical protein
MGDQDRNSTCFQIKTASYDQRFKSWQIQIKNHYHNQRTFKKQDLEFSSDELVLAKTQRNCLSDMNGIAKCK